MKFFIALLAISALALSSADQGFVLRSVNTYKNYDFGRQYVAIVYKLIVPRETFFVNGIDATYIDGKGPDDVQALHIVHQVVKYFPHKIFDWYKNLNHLHIVESGLVSLGNEPLDGRIVYVHLDGNVISEIPKGFFRNSQELMLLSMERNFITTLDADVFVNMPKLRWVSFAGNRIRTLPGNIFRVNINTECMSFEKNGLVNVGADLVKGLGKLVGVSFDGNVCINSAYMKTQDVVELLTREFTMNCGGRCDGNKIHEKMIDTLEDQIDDLEKQSPKCSPYHTQKIHNHSSESSESDEHIEDGKYGPGKPCPYAHYSPLMRRN